MNVPLLVETKIVKNKEKFSIWYNNINDIIDAPVKPYFYSFANLSVPCLKRTKVKGIKLSNYQPASFDKYEFNTRKDVVKYRSDQTFEDNIPFILRNRIDYPKLFEQYPHTKPLTFFFFDVEQYCPEGKLFPTFEDRIISIAWCTNDRKIKCVYLKKDNKSDEKLLQHFIKEFKKINPDVLVGFNSRDYDLPLIFERCKINDINISQLSKNSTEPYVGGKHKIEIAGRVNYDILISTLADQSLSGNVVNCGLKAVSNHFGFKETQKPLEGSKISELIGTKELISYNKDDIRRTLLLFDVYWGGIEYMANDLSIPLNNALDLNTTDLGLIVKGDLYKERNIIADGTNSDRYPEVFQRKKRTGEGNYQGALVFIKRRGLFKPLLKADYGSMYPTIEDEFNLSPDTCSLLGYEPYKKSGFRIEEDKDTFTYYIPDDNIKKTVVIQTLKTKGFISKAIQRFLKERAKFKADFKKTGSKTSEARSNIAKVKANGGIYGGEGNPNHPFGFAPAAVGTTGIGRECAKLLIDVLEELYPKSVIEVDTDGVYFSAENYNEERIIYYFNKALKEKFKKNLNLTIDIDTYDAGYFHKAKNYILKKGDNIILHGVGLKSSSKDPLSKHIIDELARAKLFGKSTSPIVQKYRHIRVDDFELRDFAMQVSLGKRLADYTERGRQHISFQMAMRAQRYFNIIPKRGTSYHYIKVNYGYELFQLVKKNDIDIPYYQKKINKIIEMLSSEYKLLSPLGDFIDDCSQEWLEEPITRLKTKNPVGLEGFL